MLPPPYFCLRVLVYPADIDLINFFSLERRFLLRPRLDAKLFSIFPVIIGFGVARLDELMRSSYSTLGSESELFQTNLVNQTPVGSSNQPSIKLCFSS